MENTAKSSLFFERCMIDTLHGLREGLSMFSGKSRIAVIFSLNKDSEYYIFDPQNLLGEHAPKLRDIFSNPDKPFIVEDCLCADNHSDPLIELNGLICCHSSSPSINYQVWYTEHHPDICSPEPIKYWLEHTTHCLSQDLTAQPELYTGISGNFLREYSTHAIRNFLVNKIRSDLGQNIYFPIYNLLNSILGISRTKEEGAKASGQIMFVEPKYILPEVLFLAKFDEDQQPQLVNFKHVRKLLQAVENSNRYLVSDGQKILGISNSKPPAHSLTVNFQGKIGFVHYNNEIVCSFADGSYKANSHQARLVEIEEILLDYPLDSETRASFFKIVEALVHNAQDNGFGGSIIIDLHNSPISLAGQAVSPPLDLQQFTKLKLACALTKVDGALHIRSDLKLHGFACLMDGYQLNHENRARGARYNSALRFTYHHPKTIVVVVSSDRPVSIIHRGQEYTGSLYAGVKESCMLRPQKLEEWLDENDGI